jgi:hypothetical protein
LSYTGYPIIEQATLTRGEGVRHRPEPRPSVAVVIHQPGRELVVLRESWELRPRLDALKGTMRVYWVDLSPRDQSFTFAVPCRRDAFNFQVVAQVSSRVADPGMVVQHRVEDAYRLIESHVRAAVHAISRRFDDGEALEAQDACDRAVRALVGATLAQGAFVIDSAGAVLTRDPAALEKIKQGALDVLAAQQAIELQREEGGRKALEATQETELTRIRGATGKVEAEQRQELAAIDAGARLREARLKIELTGIEGDVKLVEAKRRKELVGIEGEIRREETQQDVERLQRYFDHYLQMIPPDDQRHLLAAMVAHDPGALPRLVDMFRRDKAAGIAEVAQVLQLLIEKGNLTAAYDLKPVTEWVIAQFASRDKTDAAGPPKQLPDVISGEAVDESAEASDPDNEDDEDLPLASRLRRRTRD